jgi:hypothetical protein
MFALARLGDGQEDGTRHAVTEDNCYGRLSIQAAAPDGGSLRAAIGRKAAAEAGRN